MNSIRIKNLHCLSDTGTIPLKPINILVGANSSGKSSFLRIFPLLKQGLNTNKKGPILWLSEDVDFGDFKTAVKRGEKNIEIEFEIEFKISSIELKVITTINIVENNSNDYINNIKIAYKDQLIQLSINSKGIVESIIINKEIFPQNTILASENKSNILPIFYDKESEDISDDDLRIRPYRYQVILRDDSVDFIKKITSNKLAINTINTIKKEIGSCYFFDKKEILQRIQEIKRTKRWQSVVNKWDTKNLDFISLNNRIVLSSSFFLIEIINSRLTRYFRGVSYIGPIRATAERYYRRQNLSLNTIDPRGINLPMFINDLNETEKKDLKEWMLKYFGFHLSTDYSSGHIALSIINPTKNEKTNLADSGFGFSQIMPIILILWTLTSKNPYLRRRKNLKHSDLCYYVIEQPELHLHPALQAKLVDAFIAAISLAKENGIELKLIIETHSETIINRIGQDISEEKISKDDVTVALFGNSLNEKNENVTLAKFNEEGFLDNWPIGFFNAD